MKLRPNKYTARAKHAAYNEAARPTIKEPILAILDRKIEELLNYIENLPPDVRSIPFDFADVYLPISERHAKLLINRIRHPRTRNTFPPHTLAIPLRRPPYSRILRCRSRRGNVPAIPRPLDIPIRSRRFSREGL